MAKNGINLNSEIYQKWADEAHRRVMTPTKLINDVMRAINPGKKNNIIITVPEDVIDKGSLATKEWIENRIPHIVNLIFSEKNI